MSDTVYDTNYTVRLVSVASISQGIGGEDTVIFRVTPQFVESREVEYTQLTPIHLPGGIQVFKNTRPRTFSITAKLISRTTSEATINMMYLQKLRGWTMPYFGATSTIGTSESRNEETNNQQQVDQATTEGQGDTNDVKLDNDTIAKSLVNSQNRSGLGFELLGAPPDVLYLYAYSSMSNSGTHESGRPNKYGVNINKVPVVITSLNITYPDDVDYIPTESSGNPRESEPFPVKMDVSITLVETHSPREYERFDLLKFKQGQLVNF